MNYELLRSLPILNGVTIIGNKKFEDFGIVPISTEEVSSIMLEIFGYLL